MGRGTIAHQDTHERRLGQDKPTGRSIDPALRIAAHELKTPLAALAGAADILASELARFESDDRQLIEIIQRNSMRMIRLLDDVLLLGRIDRGELGLDLGPRRLMTPLTEQLRQFANIADSRGVVFDVLSDLEDLKVVADESRLARIIAALVGNSARFVREHGRVEIEGEAVGDRFILRFRDDGPGIVPDERERVFQRFYRGTRGADAHGGAGLGLAIAKELAMSMKGDLTLIPVEPEGSCFELSLPIAAS